MIIRKKCLYCGVEFTDRSKAKNRKFCNSAHGYHWRKDRPRLPKGELSDRELNRMYAKSARALRLSLGLHEGDKVYDPWSSRTPQLRGRIKGFDDRFGTAEVLTDDGERIDVNVVCLEVDRGETQ